MDYFREYKSFINSYYFAEGLRITVGCTVPAIVLNFFGLLDLGLVVSLGALCTSVSDLPGPALARKNGMLATVILIFVMALTTSLLVPFPVALGFFLISACFVFSMIGVYGPRVNSIGVSALLIMVLGLYRVHTGIEILYAALYAAGGGLWYMLFSLALYNFRPYRLIQQALGDSMFAIADYLRFRSRFYVAGTDPEFIYAALIDQQAQVQRKQLLVRELLFKSRNLIKESTPAGRKLVMIFTESVDLFERTTTAFHPYQDLHDLFGHTGILQKIHAFLGELVTELELNALAVQSGEGSRSPAELEAGMKKLQEEFRAFADEQRSASRLEGLLALKKILQSLEDISRRLYTLHHYTQSRDLKNLPVSDNYDQFVSRTDLDPKHFVDNLTLRSNTFRHALRLSGAMIAGYILSHLLVIGHSYWILLTILVILKPAYSVSRTRNYQRSIGTVGGALLGFGVLYFIRDRNLLFAIMLLLMTGAYSFLRTRYLLSVVLMTPYVFIMFYLLGNQDYDQVIIDRLLDTGIGSVLAFTASFILLPAWEQSQLPGYMSDALATSLLYFKNVSHRFSGKTITQLDYKLSRKNAFVSLGNLSEAFTRMLAEPRSKQKNPQAAHQFVVMAHTLNSHIATLSHLAAQLSERYQSTDFNGIIQSVEADLEHAIALIDRKPDEEQSTDEQPLQLRARVQELLNRRKQELQQGLIETETRTSLAEFKPIVDQFLFISDITTDLEKLCLEIRNQP